MQLLKNIAQHRCYCTARKIIYVARLFRQADFSLVKIKNANSTHPTMRSRDELRLFLFKQWLAIKPNI